MGRAVHKLAAITVERLSKKPGVSKKTGKPCFEHGDGGGLWLYTNPPDASSWIFRYAAPAPFIGRDGKPRAAGTAREMGLGSYPIVSLSEARDSAAAMRRLRSEGKDPLAQRAAMKATARLEIARGISFKDAATAYIDSHKAGWKNAKHGAQWAATLATYVFPVFGNLPVASVDLTLVLKVLEPIWAKKTETAGRIRGRIEAVLDWATVRGYRAGENPARWRGHLEQLLPARGKVQKVEHHSALPYAEIGAFMANLREHEESTSARALEFAILTASRTGEVIGAQWNEVDLAARLWIIPASRMKAGREHRVPLSSAAIQVLREQESIRMNDFVFPGGARGKPLSNMSMLMQLRRMGRDDLTTHGFRSCFRDWAAECTEFPAEVAEMALAHAVGDKVEAAYRRGDLFEKRRKIMEAWTTFCAIPAGGNVISMSVALAPA